LAQDRIRTSVGSLFPQEVAMRGNLCLGVVAAAAVQARAADDATEINPIRKVVNLLQAMQKKVTAEGEKEKELYEKFMCYCKTGNSDLAQSVSAAEAKIPSVTSDIEASEEKLTQTKSDLKQAQTDRTAAKQAVAEATALRKKEAATFASSKAEYDANIAAINKAVTALEKGMAGGFLQTKTADVLRKLAMSKTDLLDADRQELVAFLSGTQSTGYAPASGEITGILKEMGDTMSKTLADLTADEEAAIKTFAELSSAKAKEIEALTASIESKTKQVGELGIQIVQMKDDVSDTQAALEQDRKFMADLKKSCSTKTAEWEERSKTRAEELVALADTIKILNDDDALELFKKTLPSASASFVQISSGVARVRAHALELIRHAHQLASPQDRSGFDFLVLALSGKSKNHGGFDKVIKMVDKMVALLKQEQVDDDHKKEYCQMQFDQTDDKKKATARSIEEAENGMATAGESIDTLKEEIKALKAGIKALDKSVADATEQRKSENVEFKELMAADTSAKELLNFAKNRLNKFYNPKMYKAPPKVELSEGDRIAANMGGSSFVQVAQHRQLKDAPAPPPETWGAYTKKSEQTGGVVAMINLLIKDLDKEMTEAETEEKNSQSDYETMMTESAEKRRSDSKSLSGKVSTLADTESELESLKESHKAAGAEMMALTKYIASLHSECDWLLQYHEIRKEARTGEIEALGKAKAVLSGADFSMLQTKARGFLGRL